MLPVAAIVGRSNVGKSTLFNCLTKTRNALVSNLSQLTRDRNYGFSQVNENKFIVIDTAGVDIDQNTQLFNNIQYQLNIAISESDFIIFMVDARSGLMYDDCEIANYLRSSYSKPIFLVINKVDGLDPNIHISEFYSLGFKKIYHISASHRQGIDHLIKNIFLDVNLNITNVNYENYHDSKNKLSIKVAIIGRPNVGKSTITNCMIGNDRVIVDNSPGTTRDSIHISIEKQGIKYIIIDTAGIRKKCKINNLIEKFSIIKSMQSIEYSHVSLLVIDAQVGILDQDITLLNFIISKGRAVLIVVNKWDHNLPIDVKNHLKNTIKHRLQYIKFAKVCFISALYNQGINDLWLLINQAYDCSVKHISTSKINKIMNMAIKNHQPPMILGRQIKLKYAHSGGYNPPIIIIHGNQVTKLPDSYKRYLKNYFLLKLHIMGTPIEIRYKNSANPFVNKKINLNLTKNNTKK